VNRPLHVALVSGPDAGHAFPVIAIAVALRDRGHDVLVATGTQWQDDLRDEGLAFIEIPLLAPTPRDADVGYRLWQRAGQMAGPLADRLEAFAPDVVVADTLTRAGGFAADLLGVPWIEIAPHFLYDPDPLVPPIGLGAAPARDPFRRLNQASIRRQQAASVARGDELAAQVRAELGLSGDGRPIGRLLATLPVLEPVRAAWPGRTFVVGPLAWEPSSWPELEPPVGTGPLVLVSDSTASDVDGSIAATALSWLADVTDVRGVVTTSQDLDPIVGRVVVGRGRHSSLLPHVDLVVATAGHGLVTKALAAGVTLVLVPLHGDQRETAARVARAGLGWRVPRQGLDPERLGAAVRAALGDHAARRRAGRVAAEALRLGPARAATAVENMIAATDPR